MPKKIILIIACLWLIITCTIVELTYAKYLTKFSANANVNIESWNLVLNNQSIMSESDFSENLNLIFPATAYHSNGALVPGAIGYFEITVDSSDVTLSFKYTATCTFPNTNDITDMKVIGYALTSNAAMTPYTDDTTTPMTNYVQSSANSSTLRVYVQWMDEIQNETLNDVQDTTIAVTSGKAVVTVNVRIEQTT